MNQVRMNKDRCDKCPSSTFYKILKTENQVTLNEDRIGDPAIETRQDAE